MSAGRPLERALVAAFLENIPANVYFKDRQSRFIAVSAALARHHGLGSRNDLIGRTDFELFGREHAAAAYADEQRILSTGEPMLGKLEREDWPDGRVTWVLTDKMPLRGDSGEIVGTFGISKDVTQAKLTEDSLEQARRELADASRLAGMAEVATGVLHNVGNVLNSLAVSASVVGASLQQSKAASLSRVAEMLFLADDPKRALIPEFLASLARHLDEERAHRLKEIEHLRSNLDHIKEIVATQQAYATIAGVVEPLAAAALMEDSLRVNANGLARAGIKVERDYRPVGEARGERGKVLQILINLLRNAQHAVEGAPAGRRRIALRVGPGTDGAVRWEVEDTGVGIAEENLGRIFSHGFTTRRDGHGFGLHSSALAAREMGGTLTVRSDGPGRGATFTLELPLAAGNRIAA